MKNVFGATALAITISFFGGSAWACSETRIGACPPTPAPMVQFRGDKTLDQPIQVWVCHPYWERLDGREGPAGDPQSRWWGPTIAYGKWKANLPATYERCKRFWVKPGTAIKTIASCLNHQEISTVPMRQAGAIYLMDLR